MTARAWRGSLRAGVVWSALAASAVGCFKPNIEEGGFLCAAAGACPDGLKCAKDGRCYRKPPVVVDSGMEAPPSCPTTMPKVTPTCSDGPAPGQACNPTCQTGCACGRCNVVGSTPTCVAAGTVPLGDVCALGGADNCAPGFICLQEECGNALGRCYQFCTKDAQCMEAICQIAVDDPDGGGDTGFRTCDVPTRVCDPINNTGCPNPALNCYFTSLNKTLCDCPSKTVGKNDAPCTIYSDCAPGYVCVTLLNVETTPHCHFACEVANPACPAGSADGGTAGCMPVTPGAMYGYCLL